MSGGVQVVMQVARMVRCRSAVGGLFVGLALSVGPWGLLSAQAASDAPAGYAGVAGAKGGSAPGTVPTRYARSTVGEIYEMNFAGRTAVVGGHEYYFGHPQRGEVAEVTMYDSDYGAFELLHEGMKLELVYATFQGVRVVLRARQLASSAEVADF